MIIFSTNTIFPFFWFLFAASCFLLELSFAGFFYFLACSISALLLSCITYFFSELAIFVQLLVFVIIFFLSFFVLKKVVHKTESEMHLYKSHLDTLLGKEGEVIAEITGIVPGQVSIKNEIWLAYATKQTSIIQKGTKAVVLEIRGAHVIVKEKK